VAQISQSAVSPNSIRQSVEISVCVERASGLRIGNPAMQQVGNLRYEFEDEDENEDEVKPSVFRSECE